MDKNYIEMVVEAANRRDKYIEDNRVKPNPFVFIFKVMVFFALLKLGAWAWDLTVFTSEPTMTLAYVAVIGIGLFSIYEVSHDDQKKSLLFKFECEEEYIEDAKILALDKKYRNLK